MRWNTLLYTCLPQAMIALCIVLFYSVSCMNRKKLQSLVLYSHNSDSLLYSLIGIAIRSKMNVLTQNYEWFCFISTLLPNEKTHKQLVQLWPFVGLLLIFQDKTFSTKKGVKSLSYSRVTSTRSSLVSTKSSTWFQHLFWNQSNSINIQST